MSAVRKLARTALTRLGLAPVYFRLVEWRLTRGRETPPATDDDGVPIPPLALMARVVAHADWRLFLRSGAATARRLDAHAARAGLPFRAAQRILDFGCGAGRVIRHLPGLTGAELYGVDYQDELVDWCARHLAGAFSRNNLLPPLDFPDGHFDIVYLLSVFTHLRSDTQRVWLDELARVIRPGGLALVSFHEETQPGFPDTERARAAIRATGVYVHNDRVEGSNLIAAFQTRAQAAALFGEAFDIAALLSRQEAGVGQSLAVLRRRS